ncbi:hypothetical protein AGMMS50239_27120 [Bacteroidia bacterium]|nr:hypothetical protein AGMMS50239_27120 [Bacteroidia bacterium]
MRKIFIFISLLGLFHCFSGAAQSQKKANHSYTHQYYGMRDGLAQLQVFASFQDVYGYLWFATNNGVSRFDGKNFENYSPKDLGTEHRIKYFDQYGQAVCMISSNAVIFVYPDQTKEHYTLPDNYRIAETEIQKTGNSLYLFNCYLPGEKDLNRFAIIRFDLENKTFTQLEDNLPHLSICMSGQTIFAAAYDKRKVKLYKLENHQMQLTQSIDLGKTVHGAYFGRSRQNDWFMIRLQGSEPDFTHNIYRCVIERDSLRFRYLAQLPSLLKSVERFDDHRFLFASLQSEYPVSVFDPETGKLSPFPLSLFIVNNMLQDKEGNWWFSTEEGVYQCPRFFFETYQLGLGHNDNIWGVIKAPDGNVRFSSYSYGFWRMDSNGYLHPADIRLQHKKFPIVDGYMSNCMDERGRIFQTSGPGLLVFDPKQGGADRLELIQTGVSLAVYRDTLTNLIFFGGNHDQMNRTFNALHPDGKITTWPFDHRHIISICRDAAGKLRIGTFGGEAWLDEEKGIIVNDTVSRPYQSLISMALDEKGFLWKGTKKGLFVEDQQGKDRQIFDQTAVHFVLPYNSRYLIWGCEDKLYLLDLPAFYRDSTMAVRTFGFHDGFDILECGQNGASIDSEGYVWLAGGDKAIRFLPGQLMRIPPLQVRAPYLAAVYNAGKNDTWSLVSNRESLVFENEKNYLRFDVLQAAASAPDHLIFRYKLNGYNEQWITTRERSIVFQNISYGKYQLEIQSSLDEQQWSESALSPSITIRNPFLLTFPGLLLLASGLAGIAGVIIYYTRKISIRKQEEERRIDQLKYHAVQSKFIPHFTGNVLNSINYLISKNPQMAQRYIVEFAAFSNQTLLNSDKLYRTLDEELKYTESYLVLEKLRFEEKLMYSIRVDPAVNTQLLIPMMALQTFCENALKHGLRHKPGGGLIKVEAVVKNNYTVISVEDNGVGREKAATMKTKSTQEGLKIVNQQMLLYGKMYKKDAYLRLVDLYDAENQPAGTRCELYIRLA